MSDTVEQIKDRLSIVDVVGQYVKLTKAGKYHKGLSPFNKEKTPSFYVSPDRGLYHCFSSGKGGDMFTFVEEMEGVDFRGALKMLADKAGVEIVAEPKGQKDRREKIYAALSDAREFFVTTFKKDSEAKKYVTERGLTDETVDLWSVGYAPLDWRATLEYLTEKGHDETIVESSGLAKRPDSEDQDSVQNKKLYDRFRGRIMFPIRDISGRVIGFSGRAFPDQENQAKYINSPETAVFEKSRVLYGLDYAKSGIRKYDFAILVEGQFDLLAAYQANYSNTVALSGTAFTETHAQLIRRYTENLVLAFDGDRAGVAASGRSAAIALQAGLNVKVAALPPGEDPADVIRRDVSLWKSAIKEALHVVDFYIAHLKNSGYDERTFKLEVSRVVLPYIAAITNSIDQAHFVSRVADELKVPESAVRDEIDKLKKTTSTQAPSKTVQKEKDVVPESSHYEPFLSRGDTLERLLVGVMQSLHDEDHTALYEKVNKRLNAILGEERVQSILQSPDESRVSVIEGDLFLEKHDSEGNLGALIDELLGDLEKEMTRTTYRETVLLLKHAEKEGNTEEAEVLLKKISQLAREL